MKKHTIYLLGLVFLLMSCGGGNSADVTNAATGLDLTGFSTTELPNGFQQVTKVNADGKILEEGVIKNGKRNGTWVTYLDKKSMPKRISNFIDDVYSGPYMEYSNTGQLELICRYKNNVLHGEYMRMKNTRVLEKGVYVEGKIDGLYTKYYSNRSKPTVQQENNYKMGELDGTSKWYNEEGQLTMQYEYKNGEKISGGMIEPEAAPKEE